MSAAIFFTPLPTNTLVLASQFTTFQGYFNLYKYFGCWNFDLFKTNYHRKKQHPSTTLTLYCLGCRLTQIEVFTSYSHLVWWPLRGWNSRHNQNMWYIVLCIQIPLSWTRIQGSTSEYSCQIAFFPARVLNREHSFFLFALIQQSQKQTWQPVMHGSDSRSSQSQQQKLFCSLWEED